MRECNTCGEKYFKKKTEEKNKYLKRKFCSKSCANSFSALQRAEDITNQRFNYLTAVRKTNKKGGNAYLWEWLCDCGKIKLACAAPVKKGAIKSCGCYKRKINSEYGKKVGGWNKSHGCSGTRLFNIWHGMINRSQKQLSSNDCYEGVKVCNEWLVFENFIADMKPTYKEGLTLDRIDGTKGYFRENCRWATYKEQARNTKANRIIEFNNESHCMIEWSEIMNIPYTALTSRLYRGWSVEKALTTPLKRNNLLNI